MILANGADICGLHRHMSPALKFADTVYKKYRQKLTVTCGLNGEHSAGSKHYRGEAVDLRVHFFTKKEKKKVFLELREGLGVGYLILDEGDHFHIQLQD